MMSRVALGHTGRRLEPARVMTLAFALVGGAAVVRVAGATVGGADWYVWHVAVAGGLWCVAFALFVVVYATILLRPRFDGRPG
jgi:uncharacterized protein involved in response to NO